MLIAMRGTRDPEGWAREQFTGSRLGHARRTQRLVKVAAAMALRPGVSIPAMFDKPSQVKGAYRFCDTAAATPDAILEGPIQAARASMESRPGVYLCPEDTSEITFKGRERVEGLGPVGPGREGDGTQGFLLQTVVAIEAPEGGLYDAMARRRPVRMAGLLDQQYRVRKSRPAEERGKCWREALKRERESGLWSDSTRRIGAAPPGCRLIRIVDRGGDIYESISEYVKAGHGFVVRAAHDRRLEDEPEATRKLFAKVRSLAPLGEFTLELRQRPGQPARVARLSVAAVEVTIRSPHRPGQASGSLAPIRCTTVRVWEANPPKGVKGLEWLLLTSEPVETFEAGREVALWYALRWIIEEFHKALKTGNGAERLQLETAPRLFAAISIMSVVALRLIDLRERLRIDPEAPAEECGLSLLELAVLRALRDRPIVTVREAALAVGRLGGHMNRKGDGMPGWITLWRGMSRLLQTVEGVRLAGRIPPALLGLEGFG